MRDFGGAFGNRHGRNDEVGDQVGRVADDVQAVRHRTIQTYKARPELPLAGTPAAASGKKAGMEDRWRTLKLRSGGHQFSMGSTKKARERSGSRC